MTLIDWLFALTAVLLVAWLVMAGIIVAGDRKARRDWELEDARAEWRRTVDAMRRMEQLDLDDRGQA